MGKDLLNHLGVLDVGDGVQGRLIPRARVAQERRSEQVELYQLLTYKDDEDLREKLAEREQFYNFHRPHGAHAERKTYEVLREKIS